MSYTRVNWQNKTSTATPINATNLNTMDAGIAALDTAMADKVDKVAGKGLSTEDFTTEEKTKLANIEDGADVNVQADWGQTDDEADDYIKNKPDLSVYAEKDSLWTDATQTGNPVTIKTQSAQAAKSTELSMLPVQDLHGYSKPWVGGAGKNLIPYPYIDASGTESSGVTFTTDSQGRISASGTSTGQVTFKLATLSNLEDADYTFSADVATGTLNVQIWDETTSSSVWATRGVQSYTFTADSTHTYTLRLNRSIVDLSVSFSGLGVMLEKGSTAHSYEPYANICPISGRTQAEIVVKDEDDVTQDTVTISFGSTVYGGTLDVETGELTVDRAIVDMGLLTYTQQDTGVLQTTKDNVQTVSGSNPKRSNNTGFIMDAWTGYDTANNMRIYTDILAANFAAAASGHYLCFSLETPTTTTLTAQQIALLKGINNISTDADSLTITYFNDGESLTDADNRITGVLGDFAKVEGAKASQNYAIGDYLIFADKFCKASAAIATGEALAIGTNLTQTTIGAELKAIISQL